MTTPTYRPLPAAWRKEVLEKLPHREFAIVCVEYGWDAVAERCGWSEQFMTQIRNLLDKR